MRYKWPTNERRIEADVSGGPNEATGTRCSAVWVTSPRCVGRPFRQGVRPNSVVAGPVDDHGTVDDRRLTHKFDDQFDGNVNHIAFNIDNAWSFNFNRPALNVGRPAVYNVDNAAVLNVDDVTCHRYDARPGATFDFICVLGRLPSALGCDPGGMSGWSHV
jgi:hypothetical protein